MSIEGLARKRSQQGSALSATITRLGQARHPVSRVSVKAACVCKWPVDSSLVRSSTLKGASGIS